MEVRVRLFAALRERVGSSELVLELPEGALVGDALDRLAPVTDGVPAVMAVNREYADRALALQHGDEVALIPPVSGGSIDSLHARVVDGPIALEPLLRRVRDPRAGAVVSFQGVTRDVAELEYEAYAEMAQVQIAEIVAAAIERHGLCAAAAEHRVGTVPLSEPSVVVAASAPHRKEAFAGAREIIDEIKARAPIWKKEEGEWVEGDDAAEHLRALPAVHELASRLEAPHPLAVAAARQAIAECREAWLAGESADLEGAVEARARELLEAIQRPSLRRVINATGVILHTNLGRAPLPAAAREAVNRAAAGYSNLELDLERGARGSRHAHVERLLRELTGAEAAIAVNNGAAAVLLAVAALAGPGRAVIVSRGQLVEIGGGFRIPEVVGQSGAELVEVGTTNRTRLGDYQRALTMRPDAAVLRVHQSNFRAIGFVEEATIAELCGLGAPLVDDVGSGVLADASGIPALGEEPSIADSLAAGAALVCCSGDKLLGGPQAGLLVGTADAVAAARSHPLARAMRIDKLSLAALEATLRLYLDPDRARRAVPVLAMLEASVGVLTARAQRLANGIGPAATIIESVAKVGGGALPLLELQGPAVALESAASPVELAGALRRAEPAVLARIHDGRLLLDPRTIAEDEFDAVIASAREAVR